MKKLLLSILLMTSSIVGAEFYGMIAVPMDIDFIPSTQQIAMPIPIRLTQALPLLTTVNTTLQTQCMSQDSEGAPKPIRLAHALPSSVPAEVNNNAEISEYDQYINQEAQLLIKAQATYKMQVAQKSKSVEFMTEKQRPSPKHQRREKTPLKRLFITQPSYQEQMSEEQVLENEPKKGGFYCPFCNEKFANGPDAITHSDTPKHIANHKSSGCYQDPDKYVRRR